MDPAHSESSTWWGHRSLDPQGDPVWWEEAPPATEARALLRGREVGRCRGCRQAGVHRAGIQGSLCEDDEATGTDGVSGPRQALASVQSPRKLVTRQQGCGKGNLLQTEGAAQAGSCVAGRGRATVRKREVGGGEVPCERLGDWGGERGQCSEKCSPAAAASSVWVLRPHSRLQRPAPTPGSLAPPKPNRSGCKPRCPGN